MAENMLGKVGRGCNVTGLFVLLPLHDDVGRGGKTAMAAWCEKEASGPR